MGIFLAAKCDGCGVIRGSTNHWWTSRVSEDGKFILQPLPPDMKVAEGEKILCGQKCVFDVVSEYLGGKHGAV